MAPNSKQPDRNLEVSSLENIEALEPFRRSPHPYSRRRNELYGHATHYVISSPQRPPKLQSTSSRTSSDEERGKRRKRASQSPSESGTEADDEGISLVKALPAPPLKLHKGLRVQGFALEKPVTPLLTPTQIDEDARKFSAGYFIDYRRGSRRAEALCADNDVEIARQKYLLRRRNELIRRTTETILLAGIGALAIQGCDCWPRLLQWHRVELATHAVVMTALIVLYPLRLLYFSWRSRSSLNILCQIHLPAAFDPATILYPPIIPIVISISVFSSFSQPLVPNILLGLAALPPRLIPFRNATLGFSSLHWLLSILPIAVAQNTSIPLNLILINSKQQGDLPLPKENFNPEFLAMLFPLHQALLPPLYYLTTTSLLPAELHLLSIGLINLLLFAKLPQSEILATLLWIGGLSIFVFCGGVLKWGVALARIPRWRFRRAAQLAGTQESFLQILREGLRRSKSKALTRGDAMNSDADEDDPLLHNCLLQTQDLKKSTSEAFTSERPSSGGLISQSTVSGQTSSYYPMNSEFWISGGSHLRRKLHSSPPPKVLSNGKHTLPRKRSKSIARAHLSLTPSQASFRKWLYALYFYAVVIVIILGPIRHVIGKQSLRNHEPFGWAIGYLFGNVPRLRWEVVNWNLDWWIPLPPILDSDHYDQLSELLPPADIIRVIILGQANTRLLLCAYCVGTIVVGLLSVFSLSAYVEVDTRRKVFHATMVAMLLPTIYVDPCFVALALSLVLAIFILLDLIRASQLPPLSKPIARFLTPYVDGRDLRGPVVVSHIFLLIGCAIPLWLSLAAVERTGNEPWQDWEVKNRYVSMLAGVVCVGMGDAAASLIGRRYGRRKWPWAGGKSLEGSLAFAVAVTIGLVLGKAWLHLGWDSTQASPRSIMELTQDGVAVASKAALCAAGASLNEAVLTGGNDNVIVPVILWVLVRGVRL